MFSICYKTVCPVMGFENRSNNIMWFKNVFGMTDIYVGSSTAIFLVTQQLTFPSVSLRVMWPRGN